MPNTTDHNYIAVKGMAPNKRCDKSGQERWKMRTQKYSVIGISRVPSDTMERQWVMASQNQTQVLQQLCSNRPDKRHEFEALEDNPSN
jgi:hypothetical protein